MKKRKKAFVFVFVWLFLSQLFSWPVFGQVPTWTDSTGATPAPLKDIEVIFAKIVSIATVLAGIAVLVMLIVGGFSYLTAGDNPKTIEKAGKTLTFALIGLILVIASWLILQAIKTITGLNVTVFRIGR